MTEIETPTKTHEDVHLDIKTRWGGMPLSMAGFLLQAIGTAYPHTQIETKTSSAGISLRIPYEDFLDFEGEISDLESLVPDKDDPQLVAFTHGFINGGSVGINPPPWLASLLAQAAGMLEEEIEDHAPNYMELTILSTDGGEPFKWIICRRGRPSPHDLRLQAEERVQYLEDSIRNGLDALDKAVKTTEAAGGNALHYKQAWGIFDAILSSPQP